MRETVCSFRCQRQGFGPYYEDSKIWTILSDGDLNPFREIAVVDYAKNNDDGTMTLYFTIYSIDYDTFKNLSFDDVKKILCFDSF